MSHTSAVLSAEVPPEVGAQSYQIDLGVFSGPLDLLLFLIQREEVDIYDIPIAKITRQYLQYVELMEKLNLEVAGEFVLMAATLIRIKTRLLLPVDESDEDDGDPREELIWALVEYRKFKEASEYLREKALQEEQVYVPPCPIGKVQGRVDYLPATTLFDLAVAYKNAMTAKKPPPIHEVVPEAVSIEERMLHLVSSLRSEDGVSFESLYADVPRKINAVVTFIAMLELARARRVQVQQSVPFSAIRLYRGDNFDAPKGEIDLVDYENVALEG